MEHGPNQAHVEDVEFEAGVAGVDAFESIRKDIRIPLEFAASGVSESAKMKVLDKLNHFAVADFVSDKLYDPGVTEPGISIPEREKRLRNSMVKVFIDRLRESPEEFTGRSDNESEEAWHKFLISLEAVLIKQ